MHACSLWPAVCNVSVLVFTYNYNCNINHKTLGFEVHRFGCVCVA